MNEELMFNWVQRFMKNVPVMMVVVMMVMNDDGDDGDE